MKFEKFNTPNENRESKQDKRDEDFDLSRRDFLKKIAIAAGGAAFAGAVGKFPFSSEEELPKEGSEEEADIEPTQEQEKIEERNVESLEEILNFNIEEKIELNADKMEALKNHWKEKYKNDPDLWNSLEYAYREMGAWEPYLQEQFQKQKISTKFLNLAIPESHWQLKAKSSAGAVGPYQFMPQTARAYGLKTDYFADHPRNLDERMDPIKSAGACATLLKDLYEAGGEDWDLALSGYNGGFFWQYLQQIESDEEISYEGFLKYLEQKINIAKEKVRSNDYGKYTIDSGENLSSIAKRFGIEVDTLCKVNNIQDKDRIYAGQKLKIPISQDTKEKIFKQRIRGVVENLNYPPKFNAVCELIEEGEVKKQRKPLEYELKKISYGARTHTFKKEDKNIYQIAKNIAGVSANDILAANPRIDPNNLHKKDKLIIPSKNAKPTLEMVSKQYNKPLERLEELNPAIKNPRKPFPNNYKIRI